ncbi:MAG: glycosyltransferase family 2 protein [candidate division FCPU426 bacterium]
MRPQVTVCIPSYCRPASAARALDSALSEARRVQAEVLLLDDASPDGTYVKLKARFGKASHLRLLRNPRNLGLVRNWNKGLKLAKGAHILFMGDDDTLLPGGLEASLAAHAAHPGIGFSFGAFDVIDGEGKKRFTQRPLGRLAQVLEPAELWSWIYYYFSPVTLCAALLNTAKLRDIGGFQEKAWYAADGDALLRLAADRGAAYIPQSLSGSAWHGSNLQGEMKDQRMETVLSGIARDLPRPKALAGLDTGRLEALLRGRYAANSALLWAAASATLERDAALDDLRAQTRRLPDLADMGKPRMARASTLPGIGPAAVFAVRLLHFMRRRLAWPVGSPAQARARLERACA